MHARLSVPLLVIVSDGLWMMDNHLYSCNDLMKSASYICAIPQKD